MKIFGFELFPKVNANHEAICNGVPSGNGDINGERRTRSQIVAEPLTPALERGLVAYCLSKGINASVVVGFFSGNNSWKVPYPSVDGHVDFSCCSHTIRERCVSEQQVRQFCLHNKIPIERRYANEIKAAIRQMNYDLARGNLAQLFHCSPTEAGRIIGLADFAIHETDDGHMQMVPNNIHRDRTVYAHSGYVAHLVKKMTGADIED